MSTDVIELNGRRPEHIDERNRSRSARAAIERYLGQILKLISVEQQFFECSTVTKYFVGHARQIAMTFVDLFHISIAKWQWKAIEHDVRLFALVLVV
jgi:hypothetical protein